MLVAHPADLEHGLRCHGGMGVSELSYGKGTPARCGCPTRVAPFGEAMQDTSCAWRPAWHSLACLVATRCDIGWAAAFREAPQGLALGTGGFW